MNEKRSQGYLIFVTKEYMNLFTDIKLNINFPGLVKKCIKIFHLLFFLPISYQVSEISGHISQFGVERRQIWQCLFLF